MNEIQAVKTEKKTLKQIFKEYGRKEAIEEIKNASGVSYTTISYMASGSTISNKSTEQIIKAVKNLFGISLAYERNQELDKVSDLIKTWLQEHFPASPGQGYKTLAKKTGASLSTIQKIASGTRSGRKTLLKRIYAILEEKLPIGTETELVQEKSLEARTDVLQIKQEIDALRKSIERIEKKLLPIEFKIKWLGDVFAEDELPDIKDGAISDAREEILALAEKLKKYSSCFPEESNERESVRQALLRPVHHLLLSIMEFDKTNPSELKDVYAGFRVVMGFSKAKKKKGEKA